MKLIKSILIVFTLVTQIPTAFASNASALTVLKCHSFLQVNDPSFQQGSLQYINIIFHQGPVKGFSLLYLPDSGPSQMLFDLKSMNNFYVDMEKSIITSFWSNKSSYMSLSYIGHLQWGAFFKWNQEIIDKKFFDGPESEMICKETPDFSIFL